MTEGGRETRGHNKWYKNYVSGTVGHFNVRIILPGLGSHRQGVACVASPNFVCVTAVGRGVYLFNMG